MFRCSHFPDVCVIFTIIISKGPTFLLLSMLQSSISKCITLFSFSGGPAFSSSLQVIVSEAHGLESLRNKIIFVVMEVCLWANLPYATYATILYVLIYVLTRHCF